MAINTRPSVSFSPQLAKRVVDIPGQRQTSSRSGDSDVRKLIVGEDISLTGEITACDTLIVEGGVEASLCDSRVIEVTETGAFKGKVDIEIAEISGKFEGELTARDRLIIHSTGHVNGVIRYGQLQVESGGKITGKIEILQQKKAGQISDNNKKDG